MYGITKSAVAVWMGTSILAVGSFGAEQDPLDRAMEDAQKIQKKIDKAQAKIAKNINMARKRLGKEFAQRREERREKFLRGLRKEAFGHTWHRARMELDTEKTLLLRERLEKLQQSSKYARYRQKLDRVEEKEYLTSLELVLGSYREEEGLFRAVLKHPKFGVPVSADLPVAIEDVRKLLEQSPETAYALFGLHRGQPVLHRAWIELDEVKMHFRFRSIWVRGQVLKGHEDQVEALAFGPDGESLASGSRDTDVRLWNVATGMGMGVLRGHQKRIKAAAFSPDSSILATASSDETIRIWGALTGDSLATLKGHDKRVSALAFSPDGKLLATGSWDEKIHLWEVGTGKRTGTLSSEKGRVNSLAFSPDGKMLVSGHEGEMIDFEGGVIHLWEVASKQKKRTLRVGTPVYSVAFSPDGKYLAAASQAGNLITMWDVEKELRISSFRPQIYSDKLKRVKSVVFSPDGRVLATGSNDGIVNLWDAETGEHLQALKGHRKRVYSVAFSPDGRMLASASYDFTVRLWPQTVVGNYDDWSSIEEASRRKPEDAEIDEEEILTPEPDTLETASTVKATSEVAEATSEVAEATSEVAEATSGVAETTLGVAEATSGVAETTLGVAETEKKVEEEPEEPFVEEPEEPLIEEPLEVGEVLQIFAGDQSIQEGGSIHHGEATLSITGKVSNAFDLQKVVVLNKDQSIKADTEELLTRDLVVLEMEDSEVQYSYAFRAPEVPLDHGVNEIVVQATDVADNSMRFAFSVEAEFIGEVQVVEILEKGRELEISIGGKKVAAGDTIRNKGTKLDIECKAGVDLVNVRVRNHLIGEGREKSLSQGGSGSFLFAGEFEERGILDELVTFSFTSLPLEIGLNPITVDAVDDDGNLIRLQFVVERAAVELFPGEVYALIIGVNDYQDPAIRNLEFAENDARAIFELFIDQTHISIPKENIQTLLGKDATKDAVMKRLTDLRRDADEDDTVIFYFAGHGFSHPHVLLGKEFYLASYDADKEYLEDTAISLSNLKTKWKAITADRKLFISDSCHSGGLLNLRSGEGSPYINQVKGKITITASQADEESAELKEIGHGLFTHCLVEGLKGGADKRPYGDGDGLISVAELKEFLKQEVLVRANQIDHVQNPLIEILEEAGPSKLYLSRTGKK